MRSYDSVVFVVYVILYSVWLNRSVYVFIRLAEW